MMARKCSVCVCDDVEEINAALVGGASYRDVARQFAPLKKDAIGRHARSHIPAKLATAAAAVDLAGADRLAADVAHLRDRALAILAEAEKTKDHRTALGAIREARGVIELLGKVQGRLADGTTVNVLTGDNASLWVSISERIMGAMEGAPEDVREKVARAIGEVGNE